MMTSSMMMTSSSRAHRQLQLNHHLLVSPLPALSEASMTSSLMVTCQAPPGGCWKDGAAMLRKLASAHFCRSVRLPLRTQ